MSHRGWCSPHGGLQRLALTALLLSAAAVTPRAVQAQDDPILSQLSADGSGGARRLALLVRTRHAALRPFASRAQETMRQALADSGRHSLRAVHAALDPGGLPELGRALVEGKAQLQLGFAAYRRNDDTAAAEALDRAVRALEQGAALLDEPTPLIQAHQLMGAVQLRGGDQDRSAVRWFRRAISLAPDVPLDAAVFSSELTDLYERTRREVLTETSSLEVATQPPGAAILLDGRVVGVTPATVPLKVAGHHLLRLTLDGYLPAGSPIDLEPGKKLAVKKTLEPVRHQENFLTLVERAMTDLGEEELTADSSIHELGELLEVDELVLVRAQAARDGSVVLQGYHYDFLDGTLANIGDGQFSPTGKNVERELAQFIDDLVSARLELALAGTVPLVKPPAAATWGAKVAPAAQGAQREPGTSSGRGSILRSPWLWAGVGGVAAAGGVTAALLLAGDEEQPAPSRPDRGRLLFGFE